MTAPVCPRLGLHLHPEVVPDEGVYLLTESEPIHLSDVVYPDLVPLLDGRHTIDELFAALRDRHASHAVYAALEWLRNRGLLADGRPPRSEEDRRRAAWWESLGSSLHHARERLGAARVSVVSVGKLSTSTWVEALRAQELEVGEPAGLTVVLTEDPLDPSLPAIDARARSQGHPWLLVRPTGVKPWLGPLFVPSQTGCWECLAQRLRGHSRLDAHLERTLGRRPRRPPAGAWPGTTAALAGLVVAEVAKWLALGRSPLAGAVLTVDLDTLERREHRLVRRPQCPACGQPATPDPRQSPRPSLGPAGAPKDQHGGWRSTTPEEVVARLEHHVSPITGIIGRVEPRLSPHASVIPIYVTDHSFAQMDTERWFLREGFRKRSGGKGSTRAQALASALGESLERYCGVFHGDESRLCASRAELGPAAIHPNACMGYSARQYTERERWNASESKVCFVPEPFDDRLTLEWSPLWSLTEDKPRYLPTSACFYGYHGHHRGEPRVAVADSNGCAAGSTLAEAVLQGLFELVERDAVALWWYNRIPRPGVELESFGVPYVLELVAHYRRFARELWAIDLTSDLGIPTFAAVSRRVDQPQEDVLLGFGAHVDARVALVRAMTEVGQSLPSVPRPGQTMRYRGDNREAQRWWSTATVRSEPYLRAHPDLASRTLDSHPAPPTTSITTLLHDCVERLRGHGLEVLVLDQSRADVELAVARVVVPGLRHFWPRFGPGRLYDVPVALGWRAAPRAEADLNGYVVYF